MLVVVSKKIVKDSLSEKSGFLRFSGKPRMVHKKRKTDKLATENSFFVPRSNFKQKVRPRIF